LKSWIRESRGGREKRVVFVSLFGLAQCFETLPREIWQKSIVVANVSKKVIETALEKMSEAEEAGELQSSADVKQFWMLVKDMPRHTRDRAKTVLGACTLRFLRALIAKSKGVASDVDEQSRGRSMVVWIDPDTLDPLMQWQKASKVCSKIRALYDVSKPLPLVRAVDTAKVLSPIPDSSQMEIPSALRSLSGDFSPGVPAVPSDDPIEMLAGTLSESLISETSTTSAKGELRLKKFKSEKTSTSSADDSRSTIKEIEIIQVSDRKETLEMVPSESPYEDLPAAKLPSITPLADDNSALKEPIT
jgi:hypothetical protein